MSDFLQEIESVSEGIKPRGKPRDSRAIAEALAEFNKSHILGSDLLKCKSNSKTNARKGRLWRKAATGLPGSSGWIQQSDGKPNALEIVEGDRTESMTRQKRRAGFEHRIPVL